MLTDIFICVVDTCFDVFMMVYLWIILNKIDNNRFKLISIAIISSVPFHLIDMFQLNFVTLSMLDTIEGIKDIIIIKVLFKKTFREVVFNYFTVSFIGLFWELVITAIVTFFVDNYIIEKYVVGLLFISSLFIFSKTNWINEKFNLIDIKSNVLNYFISSSIIYYFIYKVIWYYDNKIIYNNLFIFMGAFGAMAVFQIITYFSVSKLIKEKETLKISNEYNNIINEIIQEIKQRQHDFINYKNTIMGIVAVLDDKDVKAAINNYMKDEEIYDNKINELIYIDNVVIRSIIYRSITKAKKYNVKMKYKIENNVLDNILSYNEISNVLGNLLNNAFDEVLKDECDKKNIEVNIFNLEKTSHLIIKNQVVNSNDINLNKIFARGYSTKNSMDTRGYGLYNVQQIVKLHKGYIKLNIECEEITFDIYFNNPSSISSS
ncbi:GHKL domain-containing protein [Clostridium sp. SHJSY1]|uniref:sensor histidine kinase n=1 Tax=Clostridium sp. SHJSY1 TaxID=2942483 RepID=UPI0028750127|nr:GHKL domain-containing protein [Clostridium sp. SHJSY1]MDS0527229.1 GHKL domain-containing protein [Clostridium sp. SHJSY1]